MIFGSSEKNLVWVSISEVKGWKGRYYSIFHTQSIENDGI